MKVDPESKRTSISDTVGWCLRPETRAFDNETNPPPVKLEFLSNIAFAYLGECHHLFVHGLIPPAT